MLPLQLELVSREGVADAFSQRTKREQISRNALGACFRLIVLYYFEDLKVQALKPGEKPVLRGSVRGCVKQRFTVFNAESCG